MNCDEVHEYTALLHHFFYVAKAQRVGHIPTHEGQHNLKRLMQPLETLAKGAIDQTFAKIKHGQVCRPFLLQRNQPIY